MGKVILSTSKNDVHYAEMTLPSHDGEELFVRRYSPLDEKTLRTLMIVHGINEHGGRYDHIARRFVNEGWNVIIGDHRGHGLSSGVPVHVRHFREYVNDLETIRSHFELVPQQTALLGHSMGGLIITRYLQTHPDKVAAAIMISPLLGVNVEVPRTTIAIAKLLSKLSPRFRFRSRVSPCETTRNQSVLEKRAADPLIHKSLTVGWFFAMRSALETAWEEADSVDLPLLVLQAGADSIVSPEATEYWLDLVNSDDKSFQLFPEHLHELLNEPTWQETTTKILEWLGQRIGNSDEATHSASQTNAELAIDE
ncbi:MAG: alpha/beta hydrolase [Planctomycetes bacterium]|nr:alpha/beta hydrolase [Planctomycetota bacterium]